MFSDPSDKKSNSLPKGIPSLETIQYAIKVLQQDKYVFAEYGYILQKTQYWSDIEYYIYQAKPIGRGSFGEIFKGYRVSIDNKKVSVDSKEIVLKVIRLNSGVTPDEIATEVLALQRFDPLSHVATDSENYYIIQPFIKGDDLMSAEGHLSPIIERLNIQERFDLIQKIYAELEKLHEMINEYAFIHGDIKGTNIKIDYNEATKQIVVTLLDFGTTIRVHKKDPTPLKTNEFVGTPLFLDGLNVNFRCLDFTSDVFAVTSMVAKILKAKQPYSNKIKKIAMEKKLYALKSKEKDNHRAISINNIVNEYDALIQSNPDKALQLKDDKQKALDEILARMKIQNDLEIQDYKKNFAEKIASGSHLREYRTYKQLEVDVGYHYEGLGLFKDDRVSLEDINLIQRFLEKTEAQFENKEDYLQRPSASQAKVFFGLIQQLHNKAISQSEKSDIRKLIKWMINTPKQLDEVYHSLLKISMHPSYIQKILIRPELPVLVFKALAQLPEFAGKDPDTQLLLNMLTTPSNEMNIKFAQTLLINLDTIKNKLKNCVEQKSFYQFLWHTSDQHPNVPLYLNMIHDIQSKPILIQRIALINALLEKLKKDYEDNQKSIKKSENAYYRLLADIFTAEWLGEETIRSDAKGGSLIQP